MGILLAEIASGTGFGGVFRGTVKHYQHKDWGWSEENWINKKDGFVCGTVYQAAPGEPYKEYAFGDGRRTAGLFETLSEAEAEVTKWCKP